MQEGGELGTDLGDPFQVNLGEERLLATISKTGAGGDLAKLLQSVLARVSAYAAGADQADDCTQLVIRYRGSNA